MFQLGHENILRKFFGSAWLEPIFFWLDLARADLFENAFWLGSARAGFMSSAFWLGSARAGKKPARPTPIPATWTRMTDILPYLSKIPRWNQ